MRILIYSDLHISRTSSIFPLSSNDNKYTYRQKLIIDTADWLSQIMINEKPDLIINCGDTFDQHTITSYDINVASKFFGIFLDRMKMNNINIPHLVLVGNHEMINQNFNAVSILNNIPSIIVIDEPCTLYEDLAFLPYCNFKDVLELPKGKFLFSHQDIQGSSVRTGFNLPVGLDPIELKSKYELIFNGHIHKPSIDGNLITLGSIATHGFGDDDTTTPQAYIFNTETKDMTSYKSNLWPLFRKVYIDNIDELNNELNSLDMNYKYILNLKIPYSIKEEVKEILNNYKQNIISYRLNIIIDNDIRSENNIEININNNSDVQDMFKQFLDTAELKYPKDVYYNILEMEVVK